MWCSFEDYELIDDFMNNPDEYREEFENEAPDFDLCASDTPVSRVVNADITGSGDPYFITALQLGRLWDHACNRVGFGSQDNPYPFAV